MKVFLDTNVFLEYLCARSKAEDVRDLLDVVEDHNHKAYLSSASFCTISYYLELSLKQMGIHKPEKTLRTRATLNTILEIATLAETTHTCAVTATNDSNFSDFEDSMQYQCALYNECDILITFNVKDYKNADKSLIQVMTPKEFVEKY